MRDCGAHLYTNKFEMNLLAEMGSFKKEITKNDSKRDCLSEGLNNHLKIEKVANHHPLKMVPKQDCL